MNISIDVSHARRSGLFNADLDDGRVLVRARSAPFRDAACALLDRGLAAPGDVLSMRLDGHVALVATAGALAELGQPSGRPARRDPAATPCGAAAGGGPPVVTLSRETRRFTTERAVTHGKTAPGQGSRPGGGRPLAASETQIAKVLELRARGTVLRGIVEATGLGLQTVRTILGKPRRKRSTPLVVSDAREPRRSGAMHEQSFRTIFPYLRP